MTSGGEPSADGYAYEPATQLYEPPSNFLINIANGVAPLSGNEFAEANLGRLVSMTRDRDR